MIEDRCALVLLVGLFGLVSTMLAKPVDAFSFATNGISDLPTAASLRLIAGKYSLLSRGRISRMHVAATDTDDEGGAATAAASTSVGLYKQYADYAMEQLLATGWLEEDASVPKDLSTNHAPARGAKTESIVQITTKALVPTATSEEATTSDKPVVRYARITLLETVPLGDSTEDGFVASDGIQVLNFVVLPNKDTTLPVLGIDMVSLPGSKHLLLLDAQPMTDPNPHESHWEQWYNTNVRDNEGSNDERGEGEPLKYAWGGDFPEAVQKYVSNYALWTRLQNLAETKDENEMTPTTYRAIDAIRGDLFVAFRAHLDAYLELLGNYAGNIEAAEGENHQPSYLEYRRNNDPAKPMLNSLYGAEWTQTLLDNVLFPND